MEKSPSLSATFLIATFLTVFFFSGCAASEKIGAVGTELKDAGNNIVTKVNEIKSWFTTKADQAQQAADDIQEAADSINQAADSINTLTGNMDDGTPPTETTPTTENPTTDPATSETTPTTDPITN